MLDELVCIKGRIGSINRKKRIAVFVTDEDRGQNGHPNYQVTCEFYNALAKHRVKSGDEVLVSLYADGSLGVKKYVEGYAEDEEDE